MCPEREQSVLAVVALLRQYESGCYFFRAKTAGYRSKLSQITKNIGRASVFKEYASVV